MDRPPDVPDDYEPIFLSASDGTQVLVWGRIVETTTPDGRKELQIEGMIPEE